MGVTKPLLPAPTDLSDDDGGSPDSPGDIATDVSRRTDQSHYSVPNDGRPITFSTKKLTTSKKGHARSPSQTSLLIEYFEDKQVRVKVAPSSSQKAKEAGASPAKSGETARGRAPSYTKRIPLGQKRGERGLEDSEISPTTERPPLNVEVIDLDQSEVSYVSNSRFVPAGSDVSSMPADSMLDAPIINSPQQPSTPSLKEEQNATEVKNEAKGKLKTPSTEARERSTERIAQKVMERLQQDREKGTTGRKSRHSRGLSDKSELSEDRLKSRSRRSSNASDVRSHADSSLLRARGLDSNISDGSKVSLNNPKLLATVEDVVRRLILPEIETIKRRQSIRETGASTTRRDSNSNSDLSRTDLERKLSKSSSAPHIKAKISRKNAEDRESQKNRRSSGRSDASSRRESLDSVEQEKERIRKSKANLTTAALKGHDKDTYEGNARERRKLRSKSRSRGTSITNTEDDSQIYDRDMPRLPMASAIGDSELTRDSLLSAETVESDLAEVPNSKDIATPIKEVARGSPKTVRPTASRESTDSPATTRAGAPHTPRQERSEKGLKLKSSQSDRSLSSKAKIGLGGVGLGAAGAALYGHHRGVESPTPSRGSKSREVTPSRNDKIALKDTSRMTPDTGDQRKFSFEASPEQEDRTSKARNVTSLDSSPLTERPKTQDTDRDIFLEQAYDKNRDDLPEGDNFFEDQSKLNDHYRSSLDSERDFDIESQSKDNVVAGHVRDMSFGGKAAAGQHLKEVGANPDITYTPPQVESHVASLLEPSMVSSVSDGHDTNERSRFSGVSAPKGLSNEPTDEEIHELERRTSSEERWKAIRGHAQQLSRSSPESEGQPSAVRDIQQVKMTSSGIPVAHDPMPEIGFGDAESVTTNPSLKDRQSSVLEEPMGGAQEERGHWPFEPTPPQNKRHGFIDPEDTDEAYLSAGNAALMGAAAGAAGLGIASAKQSSNKDKQRVVTPQQPAQAGRPASSPAGPRSMSKSYDEQRDTFVETPAHLKDEGYISAANAKSPGDGSPLSFSKPPPRLFDDSAPEPKAIDQRSLDEEQYQTPQKRQQYLSGNSHGMDSPLLYDAATGRGINNIQSKDVVALMDHLTVRDGHRNARDTEILVTLVRSAAEMRNSFEDMKRLMEQQHAFSSQQADNTAERAANKVLSGARALPNKMTRSLSAEPEETPPKKKNIFQRAISGLSGRSSNDLNRIEDMLMHLLDEMEDLRIAHNALSRQAAPAQPAPMPSRELDSYERLRAAPESGYEPSGHASTSASTPAQTATFAQVTPSRQGPRMHSGYGTGPYSKKISTVIEDDEDYMPPEVADPRDLDDGMLTPTQEAQQHRDRAYAKMTGAGTRGLSEDFTPTKPSDRSPAYRSGGSSLFNSMPKVSRWSKTTASSIPQERMSYENARPISEASRSGSEVNVLPPPGAPYAVADEDRLRSAGSLAKDEYDLRTPSPLMPDGRPMSMEDPKYEANRHSLTLEHPQPRQGNTDRHQYQLESQAKSYRTSYGARPSSKSPEADVFGSNESLSRHRLLANNGYANNISSDSPRSSGNSNGNMPSARQQQPGQAMPPKIRDDGPLIPPKIPLDKNVKQTLVTQSPVQSDDYTPTSSAQSYRSSRGQSAGNPAHVEEEEYPEEGDSIRNSPPGHKEYWNGDWEAPDPSYPAPRRASPYTPGGLLAPIAERYSLEQARSEYTASPSKPSRHGRNQSRTQSIREEEEDELEEFERSETPVGPAQRAIGAAAGDSPSSVRKLTGPRDMPGSSKSSPNVRNASGTSIPEVVPDSPDTTPGREGWSGRGTIRRKPAPGGHGF